MSKRRGPDTWRWCILCERTYRRSEIVEKPSFLAGEIPGMDDHTHDACPYPDCDGDAFVHGWRWARIRQRHGDYPETPVKGVCYPMYEATVVFQEST